MNSIKKRGSLFCHAVFMFALFFTIFLNACSGDGGSSNTESDSLTSVSISDASKVKPSETLELSATVNTTGNPTGITYKWEVTEGASLSSTDETKTTLTAGDDEKTVTVTFTATYGETVKSASKEIKITNSLADLIVTPGAKVTTNGWADMANNEAGMSYPDTTNIIVIDDKTYPTAKAKCTAFTNAIASGSVSNSSITATAAIIVVSGEVDLSANTITGGVTVKEWFKQFDNSTHKRTHEDIVYDIGSNKAIIGVNGAKLSYGGLRVYANHLTPENIIIQNIEFSDAHGSTEYDTSISGEYESGKKYSDSKASIDNLVIESNTKTGYVYNYVAQNIWIDHCKFSDGDCKDLLRNYNHDGALDVKAVKYMTVSYCEFTNHDKVTLIAPGDDYVSEEQRQITFHHIYYHDTVQRTPRSRGCQVHLYNCYWNSIGFSGADDNTSGSNGGFMLGPGIGSQYIVENNYFGTLNVSGATVIKYFDKTESTSTATLSKIYLNGNNKTFSTDNDATYDSVNKLKLTSHLSSTKPWTPGYSYTPSEASSLPKLIPAAAGVDKEGYTATVEVNGTTY